MAASLRHQIAEQVALAPQLYHRLVLVVGPVRSGRTSAFMALNEEMGWPLVNINLSLSARLLELTTRKRALRVARIMDDIVSELNADVVMLDNIEMLFHPDLKQDPLRVLQSMSRNRTVVASWRGALQGRTLTYASPDHPEYQRFDDPQALIVVTHTSYPFSRKAASAAEHTA